ncbi:putative receptor-like protein kinase [Acorus calamus]|uniref:Receptor-like protein kinase n=1 Tax=Acorus calamus TaxID=4465 RepID=A0AAV9EF04_ACOCL|nr:putative receptor-like protein kinase [Acorus calamus]
MKCFHFTNGGVGGGGGGGDVDGKAEAEEGFSRASSRVSWVRSLSVASSANGIGPRRSEYESDRRGLGPRPSDSRRSDELVVFGFAELKEATRGFGRSAMIGEGGFGCVYRGIVAVPEEGGGATTTRMDVAVKQLNRNGLQARSVIVNQGHKEWIAEVDFLSIVKHPNLVKLVGYCAEDDERGIQRLLVYELMPNKSLEDHLLLRGPTPLPWGLRLRIAQDAARGLAYLHEEMDFQLIFRDFKTSNILLDEDFNAKLSDFGLARQGPAEGLDHVSTSVVGTFGYVSPEYVQTGRLSAKSDVWSFGVVLYELLTGRRSIDRNLPRGEQKLLEWVKPYVSDSKKLHIIIDPRLEGQYCMKSVQKLISLANKCLMKQPKSRPKMSEVVEMLGQIIEMSNAVEAVEKAPQDEFESSREGNGSSKMRVFDVREIVSLRNRSSGRMYWNALPPGMTRTWC